MNGLELELASRKNRSVEDRLIHECKKLPEFVDLSGVERDGSVEWCLVTEDSERQHGIIFCPFCGEELK